MTRPVPAHVVAAIDQHRARMHELVALARAHQAGCNAPIDGHACPGSEAFDAIQSATRDELEDWLALAVQELAQQPAPSTTDEGTPQ